MAAGANRPASRAARSPPAVAASARQSGQEARSSRSHGAAARPRITLGHLMRTPPSTQPTQPTPPPRLARKPTERMPLSTSFPVFREAHALSPSSKQVPSPLQTQPLSNASPSQTHEPPASQPSRHKAPRRARTAPSTTDPPTLASLRRPPRLANECLPSLCSCLPCFPGMPGPLPLPHTADPYPATHAPCPLCLPMGAWPSPRAPPKTRTCLLLRGAPLAWRPRQLFRLSGPTLLCPSPDRTGGRTAALFAALLSHTSSPTLP